MFNKFKSAIYNVVGGFDSAEGAIGNLRSTLRFPYSRPHFLQFVTDDEINVSADHGIRPIICPRDITKLPWNAGYAETINAGKSKKNEDQSAVHLGYLTRCFNITTLEKSESKKRKTLFNETESKPDLENGELLDKKNYHQFTVSLPYYYFGVFDGHAGWGAAVSASKQLHHIIHEKLSDVIDLILPNSGFIYTSEEFEGPYWTSEKTVTPESAIIGALEQAFWSMDNQIGEDRFKYQLSGGCTACIALFILGKVFVSNAGDSRATIAFNGISIPMSFDFTPETETQRIRKLGACNPDWLGDEFTHLEYLRRPLKRDIGKKAVYRDYYMKGWALKTITEDDLKYPLICGEGKRSRVLATIGVTRGFGDHDLKAQFSALPIKPFLSPEPEIKVFDISEVTLSDSDFLILGTDGLWDITSNEKAVQIAASSLSQFPLEDTHKYKYRYTSAAHDLVLHARGRLTEHNWRTAEDKHATIDDISVFVIPLKAYKIEYEDWVQEAKTAYAQMIRNDCEAAMDVVKEEEKMPADQNCSLNDCEAAMDVVKEEEKMPADQNCSLNDQFSPVNNYFQDCDTNST